MPTQCCIVHTRSRRWRRASSLGKIDHFRAEMESIGLTVPARHAGERPSQSRPCRAGAFSTGRNTENLAPHPSAVATVTQPPWSCTMPSTTERPRPVPSPVGLVLKNGSKILERTSSDIPVPQRPIPGREGGVVRGEGRPSGSRAEIDLASQHDIRRDHHVAHGDGRRRRHRDRRGRGVGNGIGVDVHQRHRLELARASRQRRHAARFTTRQPRRDDQRCPPCPPPPWAAAWLGAIGWPLSTCMTRDGATRAGVAIQRPRVHTCGEPRHSCAQLPT